jgi:predicted ATPase
MSTDQTQGSEPITDEQARAKLIGYLKRNGPSRLKAMAKSLRMTYERSSRVLNLLLAEGAVEKVSDGSHRGSEVLAWCIKGDTRAAQNSGPRKSYGGAEALLAMQAAARAFLTQGARAIA